jgi:hypothetical protein
MFFPFFFPSFPFFFFTVKASSHIPYVRNNCQKYERILFQNMKQIVSNNSFIIRETMAAAKLQRNIFVKV